MKKANPFVYTDCSKCDDLQAQLRERDGQVAALARVMVKVRDLINYRDHAFGQREVPDAA